MNYIDLAKKILSMTSYVRMFIVWQRSRNAQALPSELIVRLSEFAVHQGYPEGWAEPGAEDRDTRNFFTARGGDRYRELKQIYESGDQSSFKNAVARAVCEELGEDYDAYQTAQNGHETDGEEQETPEEENPNDL